MKNVKNLKNSVKVQGKYLRNFSTHTPLWVYRSFFDLKILNLQRKGDEY